MQLRLPCRGSIVKSTDDYQFVFDRVYQQDDTHARQKLFQDLMLPVVARYAMGFNATVSCAAYTTRLCLLPRKLHSDPVAVTRSVKCKF